MCDSENYIKGKVDLTGRCLVWYLGKGQVIVHVAAVVRLD